MNGHVRKRETTRISTVLSRGNKILRRGCRDSPGCLQAWRYTTLRLATIGHRMPSMRACNVSFTLYVLAPNVLTYVKCCNSESSSKGSPGFTSASTYSGDKKATIC